MARFKIHQLLEEVSEKLKTSYDIEANIRYARAGSYEHLRRAPLYFIEPGAFTARRANVGAPLVTQSVRLLSERVVDYVDLSPTIEETLALFEEITRDLLRAPVFDSGAFLISAQTFGDAQAFVSTDVIDDGYNAVYHIG